MSQVMNSKAQIDYMNAQRNEGAIHGMLKALPLSQIEHNFGPGGYYREGLGKLARLAVDDYIRKTCKFYGIRVRLERNRRARRHIMNDVCPICLRMVKNGRRTR